MNEPGYKYLVGHLPYIHRMRWTIAWMLCAAVALTAASTAVALRKPVLRAFAGTQVRGSHFKAHEVIRIVFASDVRRVRVVRANAFGSFAALVPSAGDSCAPLRIRATGSSGDLAALALSHGLCALSSGSGTTSQTGTAPAPTGTLPDPHGPATINPGSN